MQQINAVVFDLYGTLYDVHSVAAACEATFPGQGANIARLWRQKTLEYTWLRSLMERYAGFETVTEDALRFSCAALGLALDAGSARSLSDQYLKLAPHPEMPASLRRLKDAGLPLAICSNGSRHSITQVVGNSAMKWAFDQIISVEEVQVFKPHRQVYLLAEAKAGFAREEVLFVSSNAWDASAAALFGFPVCWVNRTGAPFDELGATPAVVVRDLAEMADWVLVHMDRFA